LGVSAAFVPPFDPSLYISNPFEVSLDEALAGYWPGKLVSVTERL
jgi:hypothetical protein